MLVAGRSGHYSRVAGIYRVRLAPDQSTFAEWFRSHAVHHVDTVAEWDPTPPPVTDALIALRDARGKDAMWYGFTSGESDLYVVSESEAASIIAAADAHAATQHEAAEKKKASRDAERAAIFERAAAVGEPQVLRKATEDCDDPSEECSTDIVTEYALPDGRTETRRQHTW